MIIRNMFVLFMFLNSCIETPKQKEFIKVSTSFPVNIENDGPQLGGHFDKVAIILEPRNHKGLPFVVRNILRNLDDTWKVQIFHGIGNEAELKEKFSKEIQDGRLYLTRMVVENLSVPMYNYLMMNRSFWEAVIGERVLLFELDSALCDNSTHRIEEFLHFDYIGAPWTSTITRGCHIYQSKQNPKWKYVVDSGDLETLQSFKKWEFPPIFSSQGGKIGNSGLSLRSRKAMFKILSEYIPKSPIYWERSNDLYYACILDYPKNDLKVPTVEEASHFSTEAILYKGSLGFHKPWPWLKGEEEEIVQSFCPDYNKIKKLYSPEVKKKEGPI